MGSSRKKKVRFSPDDRVKIKREDSDLADTDLGASGMIIESNLPRFGPYLKDTFYYMATLKEYPEWCVISTTKLVLANTKHFAIRIDNLIKVEDEDEKS